MRCWGKIKLKSKFSYRVVFGGNDVIFKGVCVCEPAPLHVTSVGSNRKIAGW